jgi:response regulator RpfG family c-di-GMP phosphodiesterase
MGQPRPMRSSEVEATVLSVTADAELPVLDDAGVRDQLLAFAKDLNRIYHKERARAEELEETLHELEESYFATVKTLAFVVEARDADTRSHLSRAHD